ncbi:MAG: methyltransferase domain-containing protein [Bacteriovoracaceae bacterium]|nr:methyltransferase domain-containing protein [Bacteriovoracaceae bacterium]
MEENIRKLWDSKASEWRDWVGENGDNNRKFNSDPIIWKYADTVEGKTILDAGCGTGYLSILLAKAGAYVTGIDISPKMISVAKESASKLIFK